MAKKSVLGALFDFSFSDFITPKVIKILFIISIVLTAIGVLTYIVLAFMSGIGWGIVTLILSPIIFILYVLFARVWLEILIVIFRIHDNIAEIRHQTKK